MLCLRVHTSQLRTHIYENRGVRLQADIQSTMHCRQYTIAWLSVQCRMPQYTHTHTHTHTHQVMIQESTANNTHIFGYSLAFARHTATQCHDSRIHVSGLIQTNPIYLITSAVSFLLRRPLGTIINTLPVCPVETVPRYNYKQAIIRCNHKQIWKCILTQCILYGENKHILEMNRHQHLSINLGIARFVCVCGWGGVCCVVYVVLYVCVERACALMTSIMMILSNVIIILELWTERPRQLVSHTHTRARGRAHKYTHTHTHTPYVIQHPIIK